MGGAGNFPSSFSSLCFQHLNLFRRNKEKEAKYLMYRVDAGGIQSLFRRDSCIPTLHVYVCERLRMTCHALKGGWLDN